MCYNTYFVYVLEMRCVLIPMGDSKEIGDLRDYSFTILTPLYPSYTPTPHLSSLIFTPSFTGPFLSVLLFIKKINELKIDKEKS